MALKPEEIIGGQLSSAKRKELIIPPAKDTFRTALPFCFSVAEALRREYNTKLEDYKAGNLTLDNFKKYIEEDFTPKQLAVYEKINDLKFNPDDQDMNDFNLNSVFRAKEAGATK